jgi:hypothetical protein
MVISTNAKGLFVRFLMNAGRSGVLGPGWHPLEFEFLTHAPSPVIKFAPYVANVFPALHPHRLGLFGTTLVASRRAE